MTHTGFERAVDAYAAQSTALTTTRKDRAMDAKPLPPIDDLRKLLAYDEVTGALAWKTRPEESFASLLGARRWNTVYAGKPAGRVDPFGYRRIVIGARSYPAHRIVWAIAHGEAPPEQMHIDHVNGKRDDNRLTNLWVVTRRENQKNAKTYSTNTSGVMGVHWNGRLSKWQCTISLDGRNVHLGLFDKIDDAKAARVAAQRRHGFHNNHGRTA